MAYLIFFSFVTFLFFLKKSFSNWFLSPSGLLLLVWGAAVFLQMIIAPDYYFIIASSLLFVLFLFSFFCGDSLSYLLSLRGKKQLLHSDSYQSGNFRRNLGFFIKVLGILSIAGALMYTKVFVDYFGSLSLLLTAGWAVRGALETVSVPLFIRAILMLGYSCVILAVVYYILYRKIRWFLILPFISLFILGIVQAGRAGFIMILVQIFIGTFWKIVFDRNTEKLNSDAVLSKFPEKKLFANLIKLLCVVVFVFVTGNMLRNQDFSATADSVGDSLNSFKVYLFGGISAFSTFIESYDFDYVPEYGLGRFSFSSLYDLLGIHKNELGVYTKYLRISSADPSLVTNIFTAFRQYIDDFGIFGALFFMFIFGFVSGYYYNKGIKNNISAIAVSIGLYSIIFHTILLSITVHNGVLVSLFLPSVILKICQNKISFSR